ncbi:MAG: CHASE2 domain-containing protein, partial [Elainellaceae cyanobacterium]
MEQRWSGTVVPGLIGIGVVVAARVAGLLQPLEWAALDTALRWRPAEPTDQRVVVVGITEDDINAAGSYPIPDGVLAQLLRQLQAYRPHAIGLDIVRDIPVEPGHGELVAAFQSMDNVIGAESVIPDRLGTVIAAPPSLPSQQIAAVDSLLDGDGKLRRSLLGTPTVDGDYRFTMALQLAKVYLEQRNVTLENGINDPAAMRFGTVELPRVHPNSGGYVRADAGGNQVLLNFRSGSEPFRMVSLSQVLEGPVDPDWFRDRVVLIGLTASSTKDLVQSSAVASSNPGLVFGVEIQAHATSQLISAVLDGRSLLRVWADVWEYGWIIFWGVVGIGVSQLAQRPSRHFALVIITSVGLVGLGYISLTTGLWLSVVPALMAFLVNAVILHAVDLYNKSLQARVRERQLVIEQTFTAIHNGPLQTLAMLMRDVEDSNVSKPAVQTGLQQLNYELRGVYAAIKQEVTEDDRLYLRGQSSLDLKTPLHELLYDVYYDVLQRDFPNFVALKVKVTKFEPFDEVTLSPKQKRDLCRLLEEMLCNVGKHADGTSRLIIECRYDSPFNIIRVIDNGIGIATPQVAIVSKKTKRAPKSVQLSGQGTQQATNLARQLNA